MKDRPPSTEVVRRLTGFQKNRTGASSSNGVGHVRLGALKKGCCKVLREPLQGCFAEYWSCQAVRIKEFTTLFSGARGMHVFRGIHIRAAPPIAMDPIHAAKLQEV